MANSTLTPDTDVTLHTDPITNVRHLFRDYVDDGLLVVSVGIGWNIFRAPYNGPVEQTPVCTIRRASHAGRAPWEARHVASGRCIARKDTMGGILAAVGAFYLRAQDVVARAVDEAAAAGVVIDLAEAA